MSLIRDKVYRIKEQGMWFYQQKWENCIFQHKVITFRSKISIGIRSDNNRIRSLSFIGNSFKLWWKKKKKKSRWDTYVFLGKIFTTTWLTSFYISHVKISSVEIYCRRWEISLLAHYSRKFDFSRQTYMGENFRRHDRWKMLFFGSACLDAYSALCWGLICLYKFVVILHVIVDLEWPRY